MAKPQWRVSISISENRRWTAARRVVCQEPSAVRAIARALRSFKVHPRRITGISASARIASSLIVLLLISPTMGCAVKLTPEQEYAYNAVETCTGPTGNVGWKYWVLPNGSIRFEGRADGFSPVRRCLTEKFGYQF
jgi:hypothetical protein